ncbi:MAG: hypothetical protein QOD69_2806 [Solirubrobacteraceae bacterium]|nr:hypothetical protein [Solirubrobacteraceae bacterium]
MSGARTLRGVRASLILCLLALALAPAPAGAQAPNAPDAVVAAGVADPLAGLQAPGDTVTLSDERTTTRWAHAQELAKIRASPTTGARTITRLRYLTEDRAAEVYVVLGARLDANGLAWLQIRIPMRPNGRVGWVRSESLSQLYVVRTRLVIDRGGLRATLFETGKRIWQAPVGIGKPGTPTPRGVFWVRERLKGLGTGGAYGPWAFGTSAYANFSDWPNGGVVGIHGTNEPGLVPGRPSHGCVRVRNDKIRRLARLMPIGTPIQVR